jgi:hypothetical protein
MGGAFLIGVSDVEQINSAEGAPFQLRRGETGVAEPNVVIEERKLIKRRCALPVSVAC